MLYIKSLAAFCLLVTLSGCFGSSPVKGSLNSLEEPRPELVITGDLDDVETLEEIFLELHAGISGEISDRIHESPGNTGLLEARSIVDASFDMYSDGYIIEAINLIYDAEELLERNN